MRYLTFTLCLVLFLYAPATFGQWGTSPTLNADDSIWHSHPQIAMRSDGGFYAAWLKENPWYLDDLGNSPSYAVVQSFDSIGRVSAGWPADGRAMGIVNTPDTFLVFAPLVATSNDGGAIVACHGYWYHHTKHIYVQKYDSVGNALWNNGNPVQVSIDTTVNNRRPQVISDGDGGAIIAWKTEDLVTGAVTNISIRRIDKNGNVAAGWPSTQVMVANVDTLQETFPNIILTHDKSAVYVYYHSRLIEPHVMLTRIKLSDGSFDNGYSLNNALDLTPGRINTFMRPYIGFEPGLFMDDNNDLTIIWRMNWNDGQQEDLLLQRVHPDKSLAFAVGGKRLNRSVNFQFSDNGSYSFMRDGACNIWVAWTMIQDANTGQDIVFVNKLDKATGNWVWANDFKTTNGYSTYPTILPDGNDGAFILYYHRVSQSNTLRVFRVNSSGVAAGILPPGSQVAVPGNYNPFEPKADYTAATSRKGNAVVLWNSVEDNPRASEGRTWMVEGCNVTGTNQVCTTTFVQGDVFPSTCALITPVVELGEQQIRLYPNPTANALMIDLADVHSSGDLHFELSDAYGRVVKQQPVTAGIISTTDVSSLMAGLYFYRVVSGSVTLQTGKLVKQ